MVSYSYCLLLVNEYRHISNLSSTLNIQVRGSVYTQCLRFRVQQAMNRSNSNSSCIISGPRAWVYTVWGLFGRSVWHFCSKFHIFSLNLIIVKSFLVSLQLTPRKCKYTHYINFTTNYTQLFTCVIVLIHEMCFACWERETSKSCKSPFKI